MNRARLFALAASLATAAAPAVAVPVPPPMVGGWSEVPRAQVQAELGAAARFGVSKLPQPHGALKTIVGGERQVVAGTNYRMLVVLTGGAKWRLQVWKRLDGGMVLTRSERVR